MCDLQDTVSMYFMTSVGRQVFLLFLPKLVEIQTARGNSQTYWLQSLRDFGPRFGWGNVLGNVRTIVDCILSLFYLNE